MYSLTHSPRDLDDAPGGQAGGDDEYLSLVGFGRTCFSWNYKYVSCITFVCRKAAASCGFCGFYAAFRRVVPVCLFHIHVNATTNPAAVVVGCGCGGLVGWFVFGVGHDERVLSTRSRGRNKNKGF